MAPAEHTDRGLPLDQLIAGLGLESGSGSLESSCGNGTPRVQGLCHDSRRVRPGDLYVAIVGERFDGRDFAAKAVEAGAVAILGPLPESASETRIDLDPLGVPWIGTDDPRPLLGPLASRLYGRPHETLALVGITGTNGKSTCIRLVASILDAAGMPAGQLGTLGYFFAGREWRAGGRTTPEAPDLHRMLAGMLAAGARAATMEVSSIALDMDRVEGVTYDAAVFTNLSRDHLDYHGDMETYFSAKKRLFDQTKSDGQAVIHLGDEWGERLAADLPSCLTFGEHRGDVRVVESELDLDGIRATIETPRGQVRLRSALLGHYNLENLLTAVATAEALGIDLEAIERGLAKAGTVPGRLEAVRAPGGQAPFPALVDYAHTPDALEAALRSVRQLSDRRVAVVFGCGGERDRGKRQLMGEIAGRLADLAVLTSDNPRGEDPASILAQVEEGLRAAHDATDGREAGPSYQVEADRRRAIDLAVEQAVADMESDRPWLVVVAGKGHETTQETGDRVMPFDDRLELAAALDRALAARSQAENRPATVREAHHG